MGDTGQLDPRRIISLGFTVGSVNNYDFCVRDVKFFDENGDELTPSVD